MGLFDIFKKPQQRTPQEPPLQRAAYIDSSLPPNHPAIMLYQLTCQACGEQNDLTTCAKDIVKAADSQQVLSRKFRKQFNSFFVTHPDYENRLNTCRFQYKGNIYSLGFILELVSIVHSDLPRRILAHSNFTFQDKFGDLHTLNFLNCEEDELIEMSTEEKEDIISYALEDFEDGLEDIDLDFLKHIEGVLAEINDYYSALCEEFYGYEDIRDKKHQYPAITHFIDEYEINSLYKYNFYKNLSGTYYRFLEEEEQYYLRIFNITNTINDYIEMCTREKVYLTICYGYAKLYTHKIQESNDSIRGLLERKFGERYVAAIDKCISTMCHHPQ